MDFHFNKRDPGENPDDPTLFRVYVCTPQRIRAAAQQEGPVDTLIAQSPNTLAIATALLDQLANNVPLGKLYIVRDPGGIISAYRKP